MSVEGENDWLSKRQYSRNNGHLHHQHLSDWWNYIKKWSLNCWDEFQPLWWIQTIIARQVQHYILCEWLVWLSCFILIKPPELQEKTFSSSASMPGELVFERLFKIMIEKHNTNRSWPIREHLLALDGFVNTFPAHDYFMCSYLDSWLMQGTSQVRESATVRDLLCVREPVCVCVCVHVSLCDECTVMSARAQSSEGDKWGDRFEAVCGAAGIDL